MMEEYTELPVDIFDDPRIGKRVQVLLEGGLAGVIERVLRFPDGVEAFFVDYGSGFHRDGLDLQDIQFLE